MAHLKDLVAAVARASSIDERSVQVVARYLLADGLIHSGGRGRKVHVGPPDATNLLLGVMAMPAPKNAARATRLAREAVFFGGEIDHNGYAIMEAPPFPFMKDASGGGASLGAAADALFDEIVKHGETLDDKGRTITHLNLGIRRPGIYAEWTFESRGSIYTARYRRDDPRLDGLLGAAKEATRKRLYREDQEKSVMTVWAEVDFKTFHIIADALASETGPDYAAPARE